MREGLIEMNKKNSLSPTSEKEQDDIPITTNIIKSVFFILFFLIFLLTWFFFKCCLADL